MPRAVGDKGACGVCFAEPRRFSAILEGFSEGGTYGFSFLLAILIGSLPCSRASAPIGLSSVCIYFFALGSPVNVLAGTCNTQTAERTGEPCSGNQCSVRTLPHQCTGCNKQLGEGGAGGGSWLLWDSFQQYWHPSRWDMIHGSGGNRVFLGAPT